MEDHPPKQGEVLQKNSHVVLVVLGSKSINNLLSFRQLQNAVMYDPEAIMRLLFTPKLTKEKCRQSYNLAQNVLRRITKLLFFPLILTKMKTVAKTMTVPPPPFPSLSSAVYSNMRIIQVDLDQNSIKRGGGVLVFCLEEMVAWRKSRI